MAERPYPDFFNDVFGPIMQPGSSSHTAGPCRLGHLASDLLDEPVAAVRVILDEQGSFAGAFGVMAEDRAMLAGVLGLLPDDERLFRAFELAAAAGVQISFEFGQLDESDHPNAMKFVLTGTSGRVAELVGNSTGGGMVATVSVDGFPLCAVGDTYVLLVVDVDVDDAGADDDAGAGLREGPLARLSEALPEVVEVSVVRAPGRGVLHAFRLAAEPDLDAVRNGLAGVTPPPRVALLRPVLPVLTRSCRKPRLFATMAKWREIAAQRGLPLWEIAVQYEIDSSGLPREAVIERMRMLAGLMRRQTRAAYEEGVVVPTSPFKPEFTGRWARHAASPARLTEPLLARTIAGAYGAGAGIPGVVTVPGPMGGGGGYLYAALSAVREARGLSEDDLLRGLFVAAGIGAIAYTRTAPTGEVTGCSGEAGICGAMAAAAIVEMVGGSPEQAENAASLTLQAFTGMPCDPIPGGLCQPCRSRIIAATCMAHVFADLALAGHEAVLPLHEAIDVADAVGRQLPPELRCTSRGGACAAPAARRIRADYDRWLAETKPKERPPGNLI